MNFSKVILCGWIQHFSTSSAKFLSSFCTMVSTLIMFLLSVVGVETCLDCLHVLCRFCMKGETDKMGFDARGRNLTLSQKGITTSVTFRTYLCATKAMQTTPTMHEKASMMVIFILDANPRVWGSLNALSSVSAVCVTVVNRGLSATQSKQKT